jgi:hypothetical protein
MVVNSDMCPDYSAFFGVMGATSAMVFSGIFKLIIVKYKNNIFTSII